MGIKKAIIEFLGGTEKDLTKVVETTVVHEHFAPMASRPLFEVTFDGEKNMGEIGPIIKYHIDYEGLRLRSWQSYIESDLSQTVINKFELWVIGAGLKLQAEPNKPVLLSEDIELDAQSFSEVVEARFSVYSKSSMADYAGMDNLNLLSGKAFLNSIVGGDVLTVLRFIDNCVKIQLIDGAHVQSPIYRSQFFDEAKKKGNRIKDGIEISPRGEHVAFYVNKGLNEFERIPAKGDKSKIVMAYMLYGQEYRLDNVRGLPSISTVLETLSKLERYKEATLGSAEERAKVMMFVSHEAFSTGENPLQNRINKAIDYDAPSKTATTDDGKKLADTVAASTNKQVFNMPLGSELKTLESKAEIHFKDFYEAGADGVCSAVSIPPNVAMSKYNDSFSASRAALKDWEHTLNVKRSKFTFKWIQPIYNFFLHTEIIKNKIPAPGYLAAFAQNNLMVLEAYRTCRFVGPNVPHIDPLKEVKAERAKLGPLADNIPLTTIEAATEALNNGDSDANMEQFALELKESKKLDLVPEPEKNKPVN